MVSGLCNTWMNALLGNLFGSIGMSSPTTIYFGLCTSVESDGSIIGECSGGSYARASAPNNTSTWNTPVLGTITNKSSITFPTATGSWGGSKPSFFISTSATEISGIYTIGYGTLSTAKDITVGDTPSFAPGTLSIGLTGSN